MKNQVILSFILCVLLPCLCSLAFQIGSQHSTHLDVIKYQPELSPAEKLTPFAASPDNSFACGFVNHDYTVLRDKQINFWIP
jgi:hypothetical protein